MRCHNRHNVTTSYSYTVLAIYWFVHLPFVVVLSQTLTLNSQPLNFSITTSTTYLPTKFHVVEAERRSTRPSCLEIATNDRSSYFQLMVATTVAFDCRIKGRTTE